MVSEQGGFLLLCLVFRHQPAELEMVLCLILVVDWRMVLVEELLYLRMVKLQVKESGREQQDLEQEEVQQRLYIVGELRACYKHGEERWLRFG